MELPLLGFAIQLMIMNGEYDMGYAIQAIKEPNH